MTDDAPDIDALPMTDRRRVAAKLAGARHGAGLSDLHQHQLEAIPQQVAPAGWTLASWSAGERGGRGSGAVDDWFAEALETVEGHCLGFSARQAKGDGRADGRVARRYPLRLLSEGCFLLEVRYPLGPALRIASFLVDLGRDAQPVMPLRGESRPFHDWIEDAQKNGTLRDPTDARLAADFARVFCRFLEARGSAFLPCEDPHDPTGLAARFLGDLPAGILQLQQPWVRLTPMHGVVAGKMVHHLLHGAMMFGHDLYRMTLCLSLPMESGSDDASIVMIDDSQVPLPDGNDSWSPLIPADP
ncbi:MAG: hypothetical protein ACK4TG_09275, partial [Thermaurantiacus sp.]